MGIFRQFPYSNFHEMNMDWIIAEVRRLIDEWAHYYADWESWKGDITEIVNNLLAWFDNLDVQEEVNNKIDEMVESGELLALIAPFLPWVTPEMFGAVGDGVTDDTQAFYDAFDTGRPVHCSDVTYAVSTINISKSAYLTGTNYTIKALGNNDWNTVFNASNIDNFIIENAEIIGNGLPLSTTVYHTVFKMNNVKNIDISNCHIHDFYNRTPEIVGTVNERTAVIFTIVDYEKLNISNCTINNCVGGEFAYASCTTKAKADLARCNFSNNYMYDITDVGNIKANSFNFFGGNVTIRDNRIDNYKTDYTYFNLAGINVECTRNIITNGSASDVFDTYEAGYLYSDTLTIKDNNIICKNAIMCRFKGKTLIIENNYFKGKAVLFGTGCVRSSGTIFPFETLFSYDGAFITVINNNFNVAYVDAGIQHTTPFMPWAIGSYSALLDGGIADNIIISNNIVDMTDRPLNITHSTKSAFVELWNNFNNITIENNMLINPVRMEISATLYFWVVVLATLDRTIRKMVFQNNTLADTTLNSQSFYFKKETGMGDNTPLLDYGIDLGNVDADGGIDSNISNAGNMVIQNFLTMRTSTVSGVVNHYIIPINTTP